MRFLAILLSLFCGTFVKKVNSVPLPCTNTQGSNNCICFPGDNGYTLSVVDPQSHGLERLVVYLYRDVVTNRMFKLIPSPAKQPLFPNIPIDRTDKVNSVSPTETVASLMHESRNSGVNKGNINPVYGKNPISAPFKKWGPPWSATNRPYLPVDIGNSEVPLLDRPIFENLSPWRFNFSNNVPNDQNNMILGNLNLNPLFPNAQNYQNRPIYEHQHLNPWNPYQYSSQQASVDPGETTLWAKYNAFKGRYSFNQWFEQQMQRFKHTRAIHDVQAIDVEIIRALVRKTLLDNRMHIGSNGLIVDDNGTPIHLNNLELRSILISNPVRLNQAMQGKQVVLPKDYPYLEGILITFIYPPKMLGIIPMGKIRLGEHHRQAIPNHALIRHYYPNSQEVQLPITSRDTDYNLNTMDTASQNLQLSSEPIEDLNSEGTENRFLPVEKLKESFNKTQTTNTTNNGRRKRSINDEPKSFNSNSDLYINPIMPNVNEMTSVDEAPPLGSIWQRFNPLYTRSEGISRNPNTILTPLNPYGYHSSRSDLHSYPDYKNYHYTSGTGSETPYMSKSDPLNVPSFQSVHSDNFRADLEPYPGLEGKDFNPTVLNVQSENLLRNDFPCAGAVGDEINERIQSESLMEEDEHLQSRAGNPTRSERFPTSRKMSKKLLRKFMKTMAPGNKRNIITDPGKLDVFEDNEGPDFRIIGGNPATGSGSPVNNKGRSGFNWI